MGKILNCFKVHYPTSSWVRKDTYMKLKVEETNKLDQKG